MTDTIIGAPIIQAPIIQARGILNRFGPQLVHDGLDLEVRRGEILGIVGGSGTGKSVLLRTLIGLRRPQGGRVEILGRDLWSLGEVERQQLEQRWGVLFQEGALFTSLSVLQNIEVPMREFLDLPEALMAEVAALKLALVGLPPDAGAKFPDELSGGMRKRTGLARALALDPEIVFLDEPTAGLDPVGATAFDELVAELNRALGITVVMVTHDLDTLHRVCHRIAVLAERRVMVVGTMQTMLEHPHPWIREYFHGPRGRAALAARG
jgi:phospholipid/cholesterol/gamma-HCH transport system ATP-binding protein